MVTGWSDLLAELDASITAVEGGAMASSVDLTWARDLDPIPPDLREWAASLAQRAVQLEANLVARIRDLETDMSRHAPRLRAVQPPAPSHLDHLA